MKNKLNPLLVVVFVFLISSFCLAQVATKNLSVNGIKEPVTIRRDGRSIPYIEAANDSDLYFAQGYITASDRLWQIDLLRRVARGELAEIFGKQVLEEDKRWRRYGFSKIAEDSMATLNPQLKKALEDYARGVNAYIATLDKETQPVEFKILQYSPAAWKPTDTICLGKILADGLSSTYRLDLIRASLNSAAVRLGREKFMDLTNNTTPDDLILFGRDLNISSTGLIQNPVPVEVTAADLQFAENDAALRKSSLERVGLYAEDLAASNNWVISGKRTADGKPLLANDPHLQPAAPGIWYLTHLSTPEMRVSGVTFPGVPGIVLGHNAQIAWGATNVGPDVQDLYRETFNDKGEYKTPTRFHRRPKRRCSTLKKRATGLSSPMKRVRNLL